MMHQRMTHYEMRNFMPPVFSGVFFCDCCNSNFTFSALTENLDEKKQPPFWQMGSEAYQFSMVKFCPFCGARNTKPKPVAHKDQ